MAQPNLQLYTNWYFFFLTCHNIHYKKKHQVVILDRDKPSFRCKNLKFIRGDINNFKLLNKIIKNKIKVIYNFAAIADIAEAMSKPLQTIRINILGNVKILELCKK